MSQSAVIAIFKDTMLTIFFVAGPMLIVGLVVGVLISMFEAVTSIREMTLTFVPKIIAVGLVFLLTLPWTMAKLTTFTINIFQQITVKSITCQIYCFIGRW